MYFYSRFSKWLYEWLYDFYYIKVYAANYKDSTEAEWVLAVKMMFNYDIESNAFSILKGMVKEIVPARQVDLKNLAELDKRYVMVIISHYI